jgi:hypothetical protein
MKRTRKQLSARGKILALASMFSFCGTLFVFFVTEYSPNHWWFSGGMIGLTIACFAALFSMPEDKRNIMVKIRPPSRGVRIAAVVLGIPLTLFGGLLLVISAVSLIMNWHDIAFSNRFGGAGQAIVISAQTTLLGVFFISAGLKRSKPPDSTDESSSADDEEENNDDYGPLK